MKPRESRAAKDERIANEAGPWIHSICEDGYNGELEVVYPSRGYRGDYAEACKAAAAVLNRLRKPAPTGKRRAKVAK